MQQAINLLQLPVQELAVLIEQEIARNPLLEIDVEETYPEYEEPGGVALEEQIREHDYERESIDSRDVSFDRDDFSILQRLDEEYHDYFSEQESSHNSHSNRDEDQLKQFQDSLITAHPSLYEHLLSQFRLSYNNAPQQELEVSEMIIGNLDERGFLTTSLEELAILYDVEIFLLQSVLKKVQTLEPYGVGASDVRESFLIQLRCLKKQNTLAYRILDRHYEDLLNNRIPIIQKSLGCSASEITKAMEKDIAKLSLRPATAYVQHIVPYIIPDAHIFLDRGELIVELNDQELPSLKLNHQYFKMLEDTTVPSDTRDYIRDKLSSGKWLVRNIYQRNETLRRILILLIIKQAQFFKDPQGQLIPLTMKILAEELELHESTIARAVANKYIDTPRGLLSLRSFFTNAYVTEEGDDISAQTVKAALQELVHSEDKKKPYSDENLSKLLKDKGINCARRTIAKYRLELNIGNTTQRRKYS
jgi:RNA polymerase sigma-54 factor